MDVSRAMIGRVSGLSAVVDSENFAANDGADGESLGADSAFLIDFDLRDPRASRLVQNYFAVHVRSLRSALMKVTTQAIMRFVRRIAIATKYR